MRLAYGTGAGALAAAGAPTEAGSGVGGASFSFRMKSPNSATAPMGDHFSPSWETSSFPASSPLPSISTICGIWKGPNTLPERRRMR
jgi:hypothetical protein